jgi:hypothetical protein
VVFGETPMSAGRLWALVKHLPPGSALAREIDPQGSQWGNTEELLATLVEITDWGNRNFAAVHAKNRKHITPIKIPRPKKPTAPGKKKPKKQSEPEQMLSFFGKRLRVQEEK